MSSVIASWARIDAWLQRHVPAGWAMLADPADPSDIAAAQARLGLEFPADLVESLRCHNGLRGWASILPEGEHLSVARIVEVRELWMEIAESEGRFAVEEPGGQPWWHPLWLPFGESVGGDALVIDLRPGPGFGQMGWAVHDGCGDFDDPWPSLGAYLQATADGLVHGTDAKDKFPYLTAEGELWWTFADTAELDGAPLRPAPTD